MAIIALCETHLGTPENDARFATALETAMNCVRCIVLDAGADD